MGGRRELVVGSQCAALPRLSFLPDLAAELHGVLTDPQLGAAAPALAGGGLLRDPPRQELLDALEEAFEVADADADGATLLVALLGHGLARGDDCYPPGHVGRAWPRRRSVRPSGLGTRRHAGWPGFLATAAPR